MLFFFDRRSKDNFTPTSKTSLRMTFLPKLAKSDQNLSNDLKHFYLDRAFIPIVSARVNDAADWQARREKRGRCADETCASVSEHSA